MLNRPLLALAFVAALALTVPTGALGINPTDDDAGSGGDAGDRSEQALTIEPGTYEGRTTNPADLVDWYAFEAEEGQILTVSAPVLDPSQRLDVVDPGGETRATVPYSPASLAVPETGEWRIRVSQTWWRALLPFDPRPTPYRFGIDLTDEGTAVSADGFPGGTVVEAAWNEATDAEIRASACARQGPGAEPEVAGYMLWVNVTIDGRRETFGHGRVLGASGTGASVFVEGPAERGADAPLSVSTETFDGCVGASAAPVAEEGRIRGVVWATHAHSDSLLSLTANRSIDARTFSTDETVTWKGGSADSSRVRAPGANVAEARSTVQPLPEGFYGRFETYGAGGWARAPNGSTVAIDEGEGGIYLVSAPSGDWQFRLNGSASVLAADRYYLAGVEAPGLGLTQPFSGVGRPGQCGSIECSLTIPR